MVRFLLIGAGFVDLALAALLVAVSGFFFGAGPEGMHGGVFAIAAYVAAVLVCLVAPIAGFALNGRKRVGLGLAVAWMPPAGALAAMTLPPPY